MGHVQRKRTFAQSYLQNYLLQIFILFSMAYFQWFFSPVFDSWILHVLDWWNSMIKNTSIQTVLSAVQYSQVICIFDTMFIKRYIILVEFFYKTTFRFWIHIFQYGYVKVCENVNRIGFTFMMRYKNVKF